MQKGDIVKLVKNYLPATEGSAAGSPPFQGESEVTYVGTSRRGGYAFARIKGGACYPVLMLERVSKGGEGDSGRVLTGGPGTKAIAGPNSKVTVGWGSRVWVGEYSKVVAANDSTVVAETGAEVETGESCAVHILGSYAKVKVGLGSVVCVGTQRNHCPSIIIREGVWYHVSVALCKEVK